MEERFINLDTSVNHFKEIYFKNGKGNIFQNRSTKVRVRLVLICILLTVCIYLSALKNSEYSWLVFLSSLFTAVAIIFLIISANKFFTWKRNVKAYLDTVKKIKASKLILRPEVFELQIDDRIILERLNTLKRVDIDPSRITITSSENYLFPAKSMSPDDYDFFSNYLKKESIKITKAASND